MTQQALCFDTFSRICQCSSLPNLKVPELPEIPSLSTTGNKVLPGKKPEGEEADTYQDDGGTGNTVVIIIVCLTLVFVICAVFGLIYIRCIKKRGEQRRTQPNNSPDET